MSILDFLFPKRCVNCRKLGAYICTSCFTYISFIESGICVVCQRAAIGGITHPICKTSYTTDGVFSSLVYKGVVKKLIYQFKYKPHITALKDVLSDLFYENLIQKEAFYRQINQESILVPIPLHSSKLRKRGYNQAHLLAEGLAKRFGLEVVDCLERNRDTKTQVGLTQDLRLSNVRGAFGVKKSFYPTIKEWQQIFLVDDVSTSGATLKEAAKVLKKEGVKKVWGLTLAHGQ